MSRQVLSQTQASDYSREEERKSEGCEKGGKSRDDEQREEGGVDEERDAREREEDEEDTDTDVE